MKNSNLFQALTRGLEEQAFRVIKEYLDNHGKKPTRHGTYKVLHFSDPETKMSFYPEYTMHRIKKTQLGRYVLVAKQIGISTDEREFDLDDWGCVPIMDLMFIMEQIEMEVGNG